MTTSQAPSEATPPPPPPPSARRPPLPQPVAAAAPAPWLPGSGLGLFEPPPPPPRPRPRPRPAPPEEEEGEEAADREEAPGRCGRPRALAPEAAHAAPRLVHSGTTEVETFQEAFWWCGWLDDLQNATCGCCCSTDYVITQKGMKVRRTTPCSQAVNNVDWPSIDDVDWHSDCCYGYVELTTADNELGDVALRVRKSRAEDISTRLLNLSTGRGPHASDEVVRNFRESCTPCDPGSCLTTYQVSKTAFKVRQQRCPLVPCAGMEVNAIRWLNRHGRGNVLDIDLEEDCCFGYVDMSTSDRKFGDRTLRVGRSQAAEITQELRNLNVGIAAGAEEKKHAKFREVGPCCGFFDDCLPRFCRPCATTYTLGERSLHVQRWRPWRSWTNFVDWFRVLDVDTQRECCLGYLDVTSSDEKLQNVVLKVGGSKVDELADMIHNLRKGHGAGAADEAFRSFREAAWCDCFRCLFDPCPTRYILSDRGVKIKRTDYCTGWMSCFRTSTNYVDWHRVRDVDLEKDCCFGFLDLQTHDADLGDVRLRVRKGQVEEIASEIYNKSLGMDHEAKQDVLHQFRESGCCTCLHCYGTTYMMTQKALKVKQTTPLYSRLNNVAWHLVNDIDQERTCCCGYAGVNTSDDKLGDVILRVWPSQLDKITDAMRSLRSGKTDLEDRVVRKFYPRGWFDWVTCYRGRCCLYHPLSYWVTQSGIKVRKIRLCGSQQTNGKSGSFRQRSNHIPWRNIRDVDGRADCCWGYLDIQTADAEDPWIVVRVAASELNDLLAVLRSRGALSDGAEYHSSSPAGGVAAVVDPIMDPHDPHPFAVS